MRDAIVLSSFCGLAKTILVRYLWTRIFSQTEGKKISGFKGRGLKLLLFFLFFFFSFFFLPFSLPWASSLIKLPHTLGEFPKSDGCSWHRNAMCFLLKSEVRLQFKWIVSDSMKNGKNFKFRKILDLQILLFFTDRYTASYQTQKFV